MYLQMDVSQLTEQCRDETTRSRTMLPGPIGFCLELFRRAVVERCQPAWEAVYAQYHQLMLSWAWSCNTWCAPEDVVACALEKFLKAVGAERFVRFTSIKHLLAFLHHCVVSVRIDLWRQKKREDDARTWLGMDDPPQTDPPEQIAIEHVENLRKSGYIYSRLKDDLERLVVQQSFELGLKPQEIAALHPTRFSSAHEVSRIKERVLSRLAQDPGLKLWL